MKSISFIKFTEACNIIKSSPDEYKNIGYRAAAEKLSAAIMLPVSESTIPTLQEASGVDIRTAAGRPPGVASQALAKQIVSILQRLNMPVDDALMAMAKE